METGKEATLTIAVETDFEPARERLKAALGGEPQGAYLTFATPELLWKMLSIKRVEILRAMMGQGEMSIRAVARRVGRDVKAVHGDVTALIEMGAVERTESGRVLFPFERIHVDYTIASPAAA